MKISEFENNFKSTFFKHDNLISAFLDVFDFPKSSIERAKIDIKTNRAIIGKKIAFILSKEQMIDLEVKNWKLHKTNKSTRFVLFFDKSNFTCIDTLDDLTINDIFNNLNNYFEFFLPLLGIESNEVVDIGKPNLTYGRTIASLRNELIFSNDFDFKFRINDFICTCIFLSFTDFFLSSEHLLSKKINGCIEGNSILDLIEKNLIEVEEKYQLHIDGSYDLTNFRLNTNSIEIIKKLFSYDLSSISTDAVGSIIQNMYDSENERHNFTSQENIKRLLHPLFISEWKEKIVNSNNESELLKIYDEINNSLFFDANCGTGNFLVVAYREVSSLIKLISRKINKKLENVKPNNFIGIERDYLKSKYAKILLSFSIFEITKNIDDFKKTFNVSLVTDSPLIHNWYSLPQFEIIYIFGNIEYSGARKMSSEQKQEKELVFSNISGIGDLDYSSCWFKKSSEYLKTKKGKCAFVCTNSILQGTQTGILWPLIYKSGMKIEFAYKPFKWGNGCRNTTGVTVVIIGLSKENNKRYIFDGINAKEVPFINPYFSSDNVIVRKRSKPLCSSFPEMIKGNMPYDGGLLSDLSRSDVDEIVKQYPSSSVLFKKIVGSDEFINDIDRYCLWIEEENYEFAYSITPIRDRIDLNRSIRENKSDPAAKELAKRPHQFREMHKTTSISAVIPSVSSENRQYIPMGIIDKNTIVTNLAFVIYNCKPWILGVLLSKMHNLWIRTVCGRLEMRIRYSSKLGYNTFPFPTVSESQKYEISKCVANIIKLRESYSESSLGTLYSYLPDDLMKAHIQLDQLIEKFYRKNPFVSDDDRISCLLNLYKEME